VKIEKIEYSVHYCTLVFSNKYREFWYAVTNALLLNRDSFKHAKYFCF